MGLAVVFVFRVFVSDSSAVAVASVGRADYVAELDGGDGPCCYCFFACVEVACTFDYVLAEQLKDFFLEKADFIDASEPI